jgi:hypothetical protein
MVITTWVALLAALVGGPVLDPEPPWNPPNLVSTSATLDVLPVLASGPRSERVVTTVGSRSAETLAESNGRDERFATTINGAVFASGTSTGISWRRTPWGLTHITSSDIQGDPLDRWPRAVYGYTRTDCTVIGQTRDPQPLVVVRDAPAGGVPHWFFVDPRAKTIVREIQREGVAVATFTFASDGSGWTVTGDGPDARAVRHPEPPPSEPASFTPPPSTPGEAFSAGTSIATIQAVQNIGRQLEFGGRIDGRKATFMLDDGTPQIVISSDAANRAGVHPFLDHGVVAEMEIAGVRMRNVPVQVIDFGGGDVLVGYDFFVGHVVHIDYRTSRIQVIPHAAFTPPPDATRLPLTTREGIPLVSARIGTRSGDRFAIDLGSPRFLLAQAFVGDDLAAIGFQKWLQPPESYGFLEGPLDVRVAAIGAISFGGTAFPGPNEVSLEQARTQNLPLPLDGIIGTDVLAHFDLWFDDDAGNLFVRAPFDERPK